MQAIFDSDQGQREVLHPYQGQQEVQLTAAWRKNAALHDVSQVVLVYPYLVWKIFASHWWYTVVFKIGTQYGTKKIAPSTNIRGSVNLMHGSESGRPIYSGSGSYLVFLWSLKTYCMLPFPVWSNSVLIIRVRNIGPQTVNYRVRGVLPPVF